MSTLSARLGTVGLWAPEPRRGRPLRILSILAVVSSFLVAVWFLGRRVTDATDPPFQRHNATWEDTAAHKRRLDFSKIPSEWRLPDSVLRQAQGRRSVADDFIESLLDPSTRFITSLEVPTLMEMTGNGSLSAFSLVSAFCKRAAYGHQLNRNLLEIGFDVALEQAMALDDYWQSHRRAIGPLHGLPITMKDQFHVKGMGTTMAYVGWIDTFEGNTSSTLKYHAESEIVRELRALGAIVIAKSTLVQSLWFGETNNNILKYHVNPRNQLLSSGGSSGGEGAVQALRGSSVGIGTDIGGSVSMPAAFNGVFAIKPSSGRLPFMDVANSSPGQVNMPTVAGIIGSSVASLKYFFRSLLSAKPWLYDPDVAPLPWRQPYDIGRHARLSFGFMEFDGRVKPHPPISRALQLVSDALQASGHEILPWKPPPHWEAAEIHAEITAGDGCYDVFEQLALSGEPLIPELHESFPEGRAVVPRTAVEVEKTVLRMKKFRKDYTSYWRSTMNITSTRRPVDAVILPVVPSAAVIPGKLYYYSYITLASVIDHATMVIPVTRADKEIDKFNATYVPAGDEDRRTWESYDAETYHGAPASVQILGGRLEEEKLLAVGQIITDALRDYK